MVQVKARIGAWRRQRLLRRNARLGMTWLVALDARMSDVAAGLAMREVWQEPLTMAQREAAYRAAADELAGEWAKAVRR